MPYQAAAPASPRRSARRSRPLLLLSLLLLVPACGGESLDPDAPPTAPASPAGPTVDLARVGTLDPAPRGEHVIPVTVTRDGAVHARGKSDLSLIDLRRELEAATNRADWREPDRSSKCILVVYADAALPWVVAQCILFVAADPTVGIHQIGFAAHPRDTEEVGVLALMLPKDRGIQATRQFVDELPVLRVKMFQGEGPAADPEAVGPVLEALWTKMGRSPNAKVRLEFPRSGGVGVPTGIVLQTLDVAVRTGLTDVVFRGPALPAQDVVESAARLREHVRELTDREGATRIRVGRDHDVGAWPADRPRPDVLGIRPDDRPHVGAESVLPLVPRVLASGGFFDEEEEGPEATPPRGSPAAPATPSSEPPELDAATRKAAKELLQPVRRLTADLEARYAAAMEAKRKGDDAGWRTALEEAVALGYHVQDRWNEVIATMPANEAFDEEETAAHHFPQEAEAVINALDALANIERKLRR